MGSSEQPSAPAEGDGQDKWLQFLRNWRGKKALLSKLLDEPTPGCEITAIREALSRIESRVDELRKVEEKRRNLEEWDADLKKRTSDLRFQEECISTRELEIAKSEGYLTAKEEAIRRWEQRLELREREVRHAKGQAGDRLRRVKRLYAEMRSWEEADKIRRRDEKELQAARDRQLLSLLHQVQSMIQALTQAPEYEVAHDDPLWPFSPSGTPRGSGECDPGISSRLSDEEVVGPDPCDDQEYEERLADEEAEDEYKEEADDWMDYADEVLLGDEIDNDDDGIEDYDSDEADEEDDESYDEDDD